ncbi:MAG: PD-(D/E)XK nuclease family protein [Cytophagales bacterium]|nr:PD-(D/E)XK nuclease family protein [Cytophagales bacterium]
MTIPIKDENSLTEAFRNNLKIKPFRDAFLDIINVDWIDKDAISFEDFETQVGIGKHGQPDLVIRTKSIEILIEIKVYDTQTTSNQPLGYLKYLSKVKKDFRAVIFLVPDGYYKIQEVKKKLDENADKCDNSVITWHSLINLIDKRELASFNPLTD